MGSALGQHVSALLLVLAGSLAALPAPAEEPAAAAKPSTAQPNVHVLPTPLVIPGLNRERTVRVYLPPSYERSTRRYPVLYMHDGQNLFDDATAYAGEWGIDETLNALAASRGLRLIVVAIDNGGAERIHELNPFDSTQFGKGEGEAYVAFIVEALKPWIDQHYRTRPERVHTAIMGSSMGGLISSYAISHYPQVFGKAGIFSPAYWLAPQIFTDTEARPPARDARLYFYAGGSESQEMLPDMKRMVALLERTGLPAAHLEVQVNPVGRHNEAAWRAEFPRAILWLYREELRHPGAPQR
ncbi:MAG TPA: alpha/beta hydrolase-fold protein [Steroidobacteraceae bacterium]|nr:alpha/beta hydrolase-fold protein [Steroidobacteraceae bacterium]